MGEESRGPAPTGESPEKSALRDRRKFLKRAGKAALTAPAVALLLSADKAKADAFQLSGLQDVTANPSDRRLKQRVEQVGALPDGLPLYSFQYIWGGPLFVGVMAQDVLCVMPDAVVTGPDGYYRVDYEMLGTRMMTLSQWREAHPIAA